MRRLAVLVLMATLGWLVPEAAADEAKFLRIVKQPGLGYLQLIVMRELRLLEKRLPGVELEWRQLTSGPVIRDAMVAGQLDIGSGGLAPFIQAIDKGVGWKTLGALNEMPLYLNCARPEIASLKDVKPTDRIAMPAIGSIQHVILQMQAEKELGNPKALNQQIVTRRKMQEELLAIWEKTRKTIRFVTHSIPEAVLLGARILILTPSPGRVRRLVDNPAAGERDSEAALAVQREIQAILE